MNLITFQYTKADGSTSQRVLSPVVVPNKMYEGTDLSELNEDAQEDYVIALGKLRDDYLTKVAELQERFDLNNRYRRFNPSRMTEVKKNAV